MSSSVHSDHRNTVRVSARRFEQSPYFDFYANSETVLGVYAGRYYAVFNGEDPAETYWTLRNKAVLFDVPEKPWQIEGADSVAFLEKIFARKIASLKEGRGRYAIACTPGGGTFMDGILFKLAENRYWYVQPEGALEPWLTAHSEGFKVSISDPKSRVLQIQGPNAFKIMSDASKGAIDESMKYFHSGYFDLGGQRLYVSRTGWTGELGYEIYSDKKTDHNQLWHHLMDAGSAHGMVFGSIASMEMRRIEAGILDNQTDFDTSMNPFQAGLGAFIDLDKEDFIGRSALIPADKEPVLFGLKCEAGIPRYQGNVFEGSEAVGVVTAAAWSPALKTGIAYVRFKQARAWPGQTLEVETEGGKRASCEITGLPFYDAEKQIPRTL